MVAMGALRGPVGLAESAEPADQHSPQAQLREGPVAVVETAGMAAVAAALPAARLSECSFTAEP